MGLNETEEVIEVKNCSYVSSQQRTVLECKKYVSTGGCISVGDYQAFEWNSMALP